MLFHHHHDYGQSQCLVKYSCMAFRQLRIILSSDVSSCSRAGTPDSTCQLTQLWHLKNFKSPVLSNIGIPVFHINVLYQTLGTPSYYWVAPPVPVSFCPQNSLNSSGHGLYKVSKVSHSSDKMAGCPLVGGQFLIHTGNCWAWKTQQGYRSWHKPVRLAPTTIPCSKAQTSFVLPINPLNGAHTQSMCQLSQGLEILL
jgi:hypothetical protein